MTTLATMRNSSKETRRNRKRTLWDHIRKDLRRNLNEEQTSRLMRAIRSDIEELVEIGHVEGYQCGVNDTLNKVLILPDKLTQAPDDESDARYLAYEGWNACLLEVKRLNKPSIDT